jgi:metallo-beta-lactamase class B
MVKEATRARVLVMAGDARVIRDGGKSDFRPETELFRPVKVDSSFADGYHLKLGGTVLTAHLSPGHTWGCTTWTTTVEEDGKKCDAAIVCQVAIAGDRAPLVNNKKYPEVSVDFEKTFQVLKGLHPDVFLALRSGTFHREEKLRRRRAGEKPNAFIDRDGLSSYIAEYEGRFREQLAADKIKY